MLTALWGAGIQFWFLVLIFLVFEIAFIEHEQGVGATLTLIAFVVLAEWLYEIRWDQAVAAHPGITILGIVTYFVAGTLWGIAKWYLWVQGQARTARERYPTTYSKLAPRVSDHRPTIVMWMTYWPISALWTLINDPVRSMFRHIYNQVADFMQAIADRAFKEDEETK